VCHGASVGVSVGSVSSSTIVGYLGVRAAALSRRKGGEGVPLCRQRRYCE
jgi:hypothetical protein